MPHRIAISNHRLIRIDSDHVVFRYKDYKNGSRWKTRALPPEEFIRRFLQHVLPPRFVRIRHYGLLSNRTRKDSVQRARCLLVFSPLGALKSILGYQVLAIDTPG